MSKKFIMSYMLGACLSLISYSFTSEFRPQLTSLAPLLDKLPDLNFYTIPQEGFCAGTLVKVSDGYAYIQNLVAGDIVIDMNGNPTEVISVRSHSVHGYVDIFLPDCVVSTGYDQLLYSSEQSCWIKCRNAYCKSRCINTPTTLYALTTGTHTYCVTEHDIQVHNAEVLMEAVAAISFGHITAIDPIMLLGGATAILSTVVYNVQQTYLNSYHQPDGFIAKVMPDPILLADRFYYQARKNDLECAKQELLTIKNDLEKINALYAGRFTSQFLSNNTYTAVKILPMLSITREKALPEKRKLYLQEFRQADLALLEKQIQEIHLLLALHVNYVMSNVQQTKAVCMAVTSDVDKTVDAWNHASIHTYDIDSKAYQHALLEECVIEDLKHAVDELESVINYYRGCSNVCIREGTSIITTLELLEPVLKETKEWQVQAQDIARSNIAVMEKHFAARNVSFLELKNHIKNEFAKQKKARAAEAVKAAQLELVARNSPGGPKNNKKNDDDESDNDSNGEKNPFKTTKEATEAAEKLGFKKTNYQSKNRPVFKKGNRYITPDRTFHNGGVWKMADSVKNLENRTLRMGTYDQYLNRIGD